MNLSNLAGVLLTGTSFAIAFPANSAFAQESVAETAEAENPIDPVASEIALNFARYLAALPAFSFSYFLTSDVVADGREKLTYISSGVVAMDRDTGFFAKTEQDDNLRDYYYDGKTFTASSPDEQFFASVPYTGRYENLVEKVRANTGLVLPVWTMLTIDLPERLTSEVDAAAYLGTTRLAGQEVHHIAFTSRDEDWQIWISTDREYPLPLMLIGTRTNELGWPQFRANFVDWNTAPELDPAAFSFTPGEDDLRITMPWQPESDSQAAEQVSDDANGQAG
jgi:hypothetical protein